MGLGKSTPPVPNGGALAAGQTYGDVQTAIGSTIMQNANEQNPYGSVNYSQTGSQTIQVPIFNNQGAFQGMQSINVPQYNRNVSLNADQQNLLNQQTQIGSGLNNLAISQTNKLQNVLNSPVSDAGLPAAQNALNNPSLTRLDVGAAPNPQQQQGQFFDSGAITATTPNYDFNQGIADVGAANRNIASAGPVNQSIANAGPIQSSLPNNDYAAQRSAVENAIYSRINPQLDRDRNNLETRLVNQGLVRGTTAFNNAMDESNRQANDARMQAVLAGGQEQSRLAGLDLQSGQFGNQAQGQLFGQNQANANLFNAGQGQLFGQNQAQTQQYNAGQQQDFGQAAQRTQTQNNALQNQSQEYLARAAQMNAAQQQVYDQYLGRAAFSNQAIDANNQAAQQRYLNQTNAQQTNNELTNQEFANQQTAGNFANTARQNAFQQMLALRNQPINEVSSLMSGGQVNVPQFAQFQGSNIAQSPIASSIYGSANLAQQQYQNQLANSNATLGAIGGVAGAGLYGYMKK